MSGRALCVQFGYDLTGDRVGYAEPIAEILKRIPKRVQHGDHLGSCRLKCGKAVPFADERVSAFSGVYKEAPSKSAKVCLCPLVGFHKRLLGAAFGAKPNDIECGAHHGPPKTVSASSAAAPFVALAAKVHAQDYDDAV